MTTLPSLEDTFVPPELGEMARLERRNCLTASVVCLAIGGASLVPTQISILGLTLDARDQTLFLYLLLAIQAYFVIAFATYRHSEVAAARLSQFNDRARQEIEDYTQVLEQAGPALANPREAVDREVASFRLARETQSLRLRGRALIILRCRRCIDTALPVALGLAAITCLLYRISKLVPPVGAINDQATGLPLIQPIAP